MHQKLNIIFVSILLSTTLLGQTNLPSEEVDVIKSFEARLIESNKIKSGLPLISADSTPVSFTYHPAVPPVTIAYPGVRARPVSFGYGTNPVNYNTFLQAGIGIPGRIQCQAYTSIKGFEKFDHLQLYGYYDQLKSSKIEFQKFRTLQLGMKTGYFINETWALSGGIDYQYMNHYKYGYDHELFTLTEKETTNGFKKFGVNVSINNINKSSWRFKSELSPGVVKLLTQKDVYINWNNTISKELNEHWKSKVQLGLESNHYSDAKSPDQSISHFILQPEIIWQSGNMQANLGVQLNATKGKTYLLPQIQVSVPLIKNTVQLHAGLNSTLKTNSLESNYMNNPWLIDSLHLNNLLTRDIYGGFSGTVKSITYQAKLHYLKSDNQPFYIVDESVPHKLYNVVYDTVKGIQVDGEIGIHLSKTSKATLQITSLYLDPQKLEKPWGIPAITAEMTYYFSSIKDIWHFQTRMKYISNKEHLLTNGIKVSSKKAIDLGIHGDYWFGKNVGGYLDINNLFNQKYDLWYYYPNAGITIVGGIKARF